MTFAFKAPLDVRKERSAIQPIRTVVSDRIQRAIRTLRASLPGSTASSSSSKLNYIF